jgi:hypothetical protein
MIRRTRLHIECLEGRSVPSGIPFDAAPAFRGLDVAAARFTPWSRSDPWLWPRSSP